MYRINPSLWGAVVAVPAQAVEKHLKLASPASFKVLLYILSGRNGEQEISGIASATALTENEVRDALDYWCACSVLENDADTEKKLEESRRLEELKASLSEKDRTKENKNLRPIPVSKPTAGQIAKRMREQPELKNLYNEAQLILGGTFGYDMQGTLLMLYDHYGFPAEVIMMLLQYAAMQKNTSTSHIKSIGEDWNKNGIKTLADAEEQIKLLYYIDDIWSELKKLGVELTGDKPNSTQSAYLKAWICDMGFDAHNINEAFAIADEKGAKGSFAQANKTLKLWDKNSVKSREQLDAATNTKKKGASKATGFESSYDINELARRALYEPLVVRKRGDGKK
ncbi:MAG: DnaD domain protein [Clostridiales bacterium]|nr:DnaD domain protein [Clostridiales bacterium]